MIYLLFHLQRTSPPCLLLIRHPLNHFLHLRKLLVELQTLRIRQRPTRLDLLPGHNLLDR